MSGNDTQRKSGRSAFVPTLERAIGVAETAAPHQSALLEDAIRRAQEPTREKRQKFTAPVRRGLKLVHQLATESLDDTKPPATTTAAKFSRVQTREYNAALAWLEQNMQGGAA